MPAPCSRRHVGRAVLALALAACGDQTGPEEQRVNLAAAGGLRQFAQPQSTLQDPLQVVVTDAVSGEPVEDVQVSWRVVRGSATVSPATTTTDALGVAQVSLGLGAGSPGDTIRVEADAVANIGEAARFEALLVAPPTIASVTPASIGAGETVTIDGSGFLPAAQDNIVLFGGVRGAVTSARADRLVVTAPQCLQNRTADVRVQLGQASSAPYPVQTVAPAADDLELAVGAVVRFSGPDVDCVRIGTTQTSASYLVVSQNATDVLGLPLRYRLLGNLGGAPITVTALDAALGAGADWELVLRERERALAGTAAGRGRALLPDAAGAAQQPRVGDRRDFNVLNAEQKSVRITAEVRAVTQQAVLYVDRDAPANGFTQAELESFGVLFDDPIYRTVSDVFGEPSDVDGNGRIVVLFTPRVNALTERGEDGFVAGYFYGCDLVPATRCRDTNRAEIFYSMVPDPRGQFGDTRTKGDVLRAVPSILAHEFQHMIHFGRKGSLDVLWLSEGLAHAAEHLVGEVYRARGDDVTADQFQVANFARGHRYLQNTAAVSLIGEDSPGTLELRGAAWLFTTYIAGHYGGHDLLGQLTGSSANGVANVTAATGQPWTTLLSDFAVALWADEAPELFSVPIDPRYTFPDIDLRHALGRFTGGFGLRPSTLAIHDFAIDGTLAAAAHDYTRLDAASAPAPSFSLSLSGRHGDVAPAHTQPQLTVLRVR